MISRKQNRIIGISCAAVALGLLIPSLVLALSDTDFLDRSQTKTLDVSSLRQNKFGTFGKKITELSTKRGSLVLETFSLTFTKDGFLKEGLINYQIAEPGQKITGYQFHKSADSVMATVQRTARTTRREKDMSREESWAKESFALIADTHINDGKEYEYEDKGTIEADGQGLDCGINLAIFNYLYQDGKLEHISKLAKGKTYLLITKTHFSGHLADQNINYYLPSAK